MRDATERYIWLNPYTHIDGKQWHAYVTDELPDKKLPRGFYLVHNQVQPQRDEVQQLLALLCERLHERLQQDGTPPRTVITLTAGQWHEVTKR